MWAAKWKFPGEGSSKLHLEPGLGLTLRPLTCWQRPAQWLGDANSNAADGGSGFDFSYLLPQVFSVVP